MSCPTSKNSLQMMDSYTLCGMGCFSSLYASTGTCRTLSAHVMMGCCKSCLEEHRDLNVRQQYLAKRV